MKKGPNSDRRKKVGVRLLEDTRLRLLARSAELGGIGMGRVIDNLAKYCLPKARAK